MSIHNRLAVWGGITNSSVWVAAFAVSGNLLYLALGLVWIAMPAAILYTTRKDQP